MLLRWIALVAREAHRTRCLINADNRAHHPVALGKLRPCARIPAIDMIEAIAFGRPEQTAVLQKAQIFVEIEPSVCVFRKEYSRRARRRVNLKHI